MGALLGTESILMELGAIILPRNHNATVARSENSRRAATRHRGTIAKHWKADHHQIRHRVLVQRQDAFGPATSANGINARYWELPH